MYVSKDNESGRPWRENRLLSRTQHGTCRVYKEAEETQAHLLTNVVLHCRRMLFCAFNVSVEEIEPL